MRHVPRLIRGGTAALLVAASACSSDSPIQASNDDVRVAASISDGGNSGLVAGVFWLTPTFADQKTFPGTFDPALQPEIDICPISDDTKFGSSACTSAAVRTLSGSSQPEIIRVDLAAENYSVTWLSTAGAGIGAGGTYRALLRVGTRLLGWIDLKGVEKQRDLKGTPTGYSGFVVGSPFIFKFRIETGIPGAVVVSPTPVTIMDNETQLFSAVVTDLHGNLLPGVTVNWSADDATIASMSPASGTTDGAGAVSSTATPVLGQGGTTTVRANSQGAEGTADLTVQRAVGSVTVTPADPDIGDSQTQLFTATVRDLTNNLLSGVDVTWTIDDASIAALSPTAGTTDATGTTTTTATPTGKLGSTTVRATAGGVEGSTSLTVSCTASSADTDGDRLPDCYETNTGLFVSTTNTGTDPNNPDTDGDNIGDGDETLGTLSGLNLPLLGTNPLRRDILLEYDWFNDNLDPGTCGAHSHQPTAAMIARLTASFTSAPVNNPDGSTGINVINDYGQGGNFTGGNLINDADGVIAGGVDDAEFASHKSANFAANRNGYFHYVLLPHRYNTTSNSSGQAEIGGDDLIVSLQCYSSTTNTANTIMHELGHNLNLLHGGFENLNYKPNYNSVMNYLYQFPGIDNNCSSEGRDPISGARLFGDGVLSFSVGTRPALNENSLNEPQGVCGNPPGPGVDWNSDGDATDIGLAFNINPDWGAALTTLQDYNDWANISFSGIGDADGSSNLVARRFAAFSRLAQKEIVSCDNTPPPPGR